MHRILLVSDTHGKTEALKDLIRRVKPERILHMGDVEGDEGMIRAFAGCPVDFVKGNCDWTSREPSELVFEIHGHRIFMTHGHLYSVTSGVDSLVYAAQEAGADIALFGHTHVPEYGVIDGIHVVNPGSLTRPRQGDHHPSFAILELDDKGGIFVTLNTLNTAI